MYLAPFGLNQHQFHMFNVVNDYVPDNPDPTPERIAQWRGWVDRQFDKIQPTVVAAVGRFAARELLGYKFHDKLLSMDLIHGMAFPPGYFDPSVAHRLPTDCVVVPIEHPAAGMHQPRRKPSIAKDYAALADVIQGRPARQPIEDPHLGTEDYRDVDGYELINLIRQGFVTGDEIGIDTEGNAPHYWSVQFSSHPGTGVTMRTGVRGFSEGIAAIQQLVDGGAKVTAHFALHDIPACRAMGLELSRAHMHDSMYPLFLLETEAQGLDTAGWRWCGAWTAKYSSIVGDLAKAQQAEYLQKASKIDWPVVSTRDVLQNDGTVKHNYSPQSVGRKVATLLHDILTDKRNKKGEPVNVLDRWYKASGERYMKDAAFEKRKMVEAKLGPMPEATLQDVYGHGPEGRHKVIHYASRDADVALRLERALSEVVDAEGFTYQYRKGMKVAALVEEIQATGMPVCRANAEALRDEFDQKAADLQQQISREYFDGGSYNPRSTKHIASLCERLKIKPLGKTKKGNPSYGAKSISYAQGKHEVIRNHFRAKNYLHMSTYFLRAISQRCDVEKEISFVSSYDDDVDETDGDAVDNNDSTTDDFSFIHCRFNTTRTASGRMSTSSLSGKGQIKLNLLNMPSHGEGLRIREVFVAPPGMVMVASDLSGIEPRVLAHLSRDPLLCDIFHQGKRLYKETAAHFLNKPPSQVTKDEDLLFKIVTLLNFYGGGGTLLRDRLYSEGVFDYDEHQGQAMLDGWWDVYKGAKAYKQQLVAQGRRDGYVQVYIDGNPGIRRTLPALRSNNKRDRFEAERQAISHKVSASAQAMIQNSMAWLKSQLDSLRDDGVRVSCAMQIHDELVAICDEADGVPEMVGQLLVEALTRHHGVSDMSVPVTAGYLVGKNWGELKD
jgi:uracil-DNA glycosylase family 4